MYTKPVSPQPIGGVLDSGFSLYRHALKETFVFAFMSALVSAPGARMLQISPGEPVDVWPLTLVFFATLALSVLFFTPVIAKIDAVQHGEGLTAGAAMVLGFRRLPVVLAVTLLYSLALGVGTALLLFPGIYLFVALIFAPVAAITESKGVVASFKYSFELVRGRWWRTFVLVSVITIVWLVLYSLIGYVVLAIGGASQLEQRPWPIDFLVSPLMGGLLTPLLFALLMAVYADSKLRNEGGDIAERIAAAEA